MGRGAVRLDHSLGLRVGAPPHLQVVPLQWGVRVGSQPSLVRGIQLLCCDALPQDLDIWEVKARQLAVARQRRDAAEEQLYANPSDAQVATMAAAVAAARHTHAMVRAARARARGRDALAWGRDALGGSPCGDETPWRAVRAGRESPRAHTHTSRA